MDTHLRRENIKPTQDPEDKIQPMRVATDYFVKSNKATETQRDERKKIKNIEPAIPEDNHMFTGTFRDGIRRIDVVLVTQKSTKPDVEDIKTTYLTNIIQSGLQIEIEPGRMMNHKNLIFIKIHAPDSVLDEYGVKFKVKSHFKNSRVDFITPKRTLLEKIFVFTKIQHEREWIKIIRKNYKEPLFYSNAERSLIVYKILLFLPFGDQLNYLGLNRLLNDQIFLDVYALHDGPYFFLPKQNLSRVTARQILCYNWVGLKNIFKVQPINLIYEYFGPGIGFYFAFYDFYNQALAVASLIGITTTALEYFDKTDNELLNDTCNANEDIWICPECVKFNICPFRRLKDYCGMVYWNIFFDNPFTVFFSIFMVVWANLFVILWKRRQCYWNWMWELDRNKTVYQRSIRPDFVMDYSNVKTSENTGIVKYYERGLRKFWRFFLTKLILLICILGIISFIALSIFYKDHLRSSLFQYWTSQDLQYAYLALFQVAYVVIISILERICKVISYNLVEFENHRTHLTYERSLVEKLFGYSFVFTFSMIMYVAWSKGLFFLVIYEDYNYFYAKRSYLFYELLPFLEDREIFLRNCGPFTCINELSIVLFIVLFLKQIVFRIFDCVTSLRTDYNQKVKINKSGVNVTIPCWEYEYRLQPVTNYLLMDKYNTLAQQFGLVTLFVAAFPLAPLLALLINIWDIRYHAGLFLMSSRRPLLLRKSGLGPWTCVFVFISFLAILSNAFTIVRDTRTTKRLSHYSEFGNLTGYLNHTLVTFWTGHFNYTEGFINEMRNYKGEIPKECYYSGFIKDFSGHHSDPDKFIKMRFYDTLFVYVYEHLLICIMVFLYYIIPPCPDELKETVKLENKIKETYFRKTK